MNSSDWIDADTACALLGVQPQTLYAYVSRKRLRARSDVSDARRSLYARVDVETLVSQSRRPRARADVAARAIRWGEPVLSTAISEVRDGMLYLRGRRVTTCSRDMTLEAMAAHLWEADTLDFQSEDIALTGNDALSRALSFLATATAGAPPSQNRPAQDIAAEAAPLVSAVVDAMLGRRVSGPLHARVARAWGLDRATEDALRQTMVSLSDHELNPSTFAVRVCASTGASLPATLIAGLATLSGPRHGGVAGLSRAAIEAALQGDMGTFLKRQKRSSPYGFGYGHPLYPEGDPRARIVLNLLPTDAPARKAVRALSKHLNTPPNIDAALGALTLHHGLPASTGTTLFAIGRLIGWVAHAIEQVEDGTLIRPRARYTGPRP